MASYSGQARLDNVNISDWRREEVGPYIGYLPQDIELFNGTVADNLARFGKVDSEKAVEAAKLAGAHNMILELPDGYDTIIGSAATICQVDNDNASASLVLFYGLPLSLFG